MAFVKNDYVITVTEALDKAVTDNGGSAPAENYDIALAMGNALQTAISQLEIATVVAAGIAVQTVPATGTGATNAPGSGSGVAT